MVSASLFQIRADGRDEKQLSLGRYILVRERHYTKEHNGTPISQAMLSHNFSLTQKETRIISQSAFRHLLFVYSRGATC